MISKIRNSRVFRILFVIVQILLMYRIVIKLEASVERISNIPRDMLIGEGVLILFIIYFINRIDIFKKVYTWIAAVGCALIIFTVLTVKNIHVSTYGPDLYRAILYTCLVSGCFVTVLTERICSHSIAGIFKKNGLVIAIFVILSAIALPAHQISYILIIFPALTLLLTDIKKEKWIELTDCFAVGYYLAFFQLFTHSLIYNPDRSYLGRFLGSFSQIETGGMFCGGAIVCVIYLWLRFKGEFGKEWIGTILAVILGIYPLYSMVLFSSRSTIIALFILGLFVFVFLHGKGKKQTVVRCIVSAVILLLLTGGVIGFSYYLGYKYAGVEFEEIPYVFNRILALTDKEFSSGIFGDSSILNNIDMALSGRLSGWYNSLAQIRLAGHPFEETPIILELTITTAHNFFIMWLINYGFIGGTVYIIWFLAEFLLMTYAAVKKKDYVLFSVLWIYYCLGNFMFSCITWRYVVGFILLLVQYPLIWVIQDLREGNNKKKKRELTEE